MTSAGKCAEGFHARAPGLGKDSSHVTLVVSCVPFRSLQRLVPHDLYQESPAEMSSGPEAAWEAAPGPLPALPAPTEALSGDTSHFLPSIPGKRGTGRRGRPSPASVRLGVALGQCHWVGFKGKLRPSVSQRQLCDSAPRAQQLRGSAIPQPLPSLYGDDE